MILLVHIWKTEINTECLLSPYFNIIVIITVVSIIFMIMIICFPHFYQFFVIFLQCVLIIFILLPQLIQDSILPPCIYNFVYFFCFFVCFEIHCIQLVLFMYIVECISFQNFVANLSGAKCLEKINSPSPSSY